MLAAVSTNQDLSMDSSSEWIIQARNSQPLAGRYLPCGMNLFVDSSSGYWSAILAAPDSNNHVPVEEHLLVGRLITKQLQWGIEQKEDWCNIRSIQRILEPLRNNINISEPQSDLTPITNSINESIILDSINKLNHAINDIVNKAFNDQTLNISGIVKKAMRSAAPLEVTINTPEGED